MAISLLTYTGEEVLWPERLARSIPANLPDHDLLGRLFEAWGEITPERRWRIVELADDLRTASRAERSADAHARPEEEEK